MDDIIKNWNATIPDFPLTAENLSKPKPMFFIEAVLKLFESIDIQTDSFIRSRPDNINSENLEAFCELIPLMNLTEAINFMLIETYSDCKPITIVDLLSPTQATVQTVLRLLHNLVLFISERRLEIRQREEEIDEFSQALSMMALETEQIKIEIDDTYLDNAKTEKHIHQMEKENLQMKKNNMELEKKGNELKTQYDLVQAEIESIQSNCLHEQKIQDEIEEEMAKLNAQDLAIQRDKELKEKLDDICKKLWKKEADIKIFQADVQYLSESQALLENIQEVYEKIKGIRKSNKTTYEEEKDLRRLQEENFVLQKKIDEYNFNNKNLSENLNELNTQLDNEEQEILREESVTLKEYEDCKSESNEVLKKVECLQLNTLKYNSEYQRLMKHYIEDIPTTYDREIENFVDDIESILDDVKKDMKNF